MMALTSAFRLGPEGTRHPVFTRRKVRLRRRLRRTGAASAAGLRERFLVALADGTGFDAACDIAGLNRAEVVMARARDARFAEAWDQVADAKRAEMEAMLLDRGAAALRAPPVADAQGGLGLEKPTAALVQWMLGPPRVPRPVRGAEVRPTAAGVPAPAAALDEAEAEAILAKALVRLEAAEAALAAGVAED